MSMPTATQTRLRIPTPLRRYTGEQASIDVSGTTVGEALRDLVVQFPTLEQHLYDEAGKLRSFVNVYRNDDDIRYLDGPETPLRPYDELSIIPAVAGGNA